MDRSQLKRMLEFSKGVREVPVIVENGQVTIGYAGVAEKSDSTRFGLPIIELRSLFVIPSSLVCDDLARTPARQGNAFLVSRAYT